MQPATTYRPKNYSSRQWTYEQELSIQADRDPQVAESMNNLATVLQELGEYSDALDLYRRALEIERGSLGRSHPAVAQSLNNIGSLYLDTGSYAEAASYLEGALGIRRKRLPANHLRSLRPSRTWLLSTTIP